MEQKNLGLKLNSHSRSRLNSLLSDATFTQVPLILLGLGQHSEDLFSKDTGQPLITAPIQPIEVVVDNVLRIQDSDLRNHVVITFEKCVALQAYLQGLGIWNDEYTAHAILADELSGSTRTRHYVTNLGSILHGEKLVFDNTLVISYRKLYILPENYAY